MTDVLTVPDLRVAQAAQRAHFPLVQIPTAVSVSLAEAKTWTPEGVFVNILAAGTNYATSSTPESHDLGAWQINDVAHADLLAAHDWRDVNQNAVMAYLIWLDRARWDANGWNAWSAYAAGKHKPYLERGQVAFLSLFPQILKRYLKLGSSGDDVRQLQRCLALDGGIDGVLGNLTQAALKRFQSAHGLVSDGVVGPLTARALLWSWAA